MFEVGKWYRVKMWEDGPDGGLITDFAPARVLEYNHPLVKLKSSTLGGGGEVILNTASLAFVRAEQADQ